MKKIICLTLILSLLTINIGIPVLAATPIQALENVGIKVIHNPKIQTDQDSRIQPEDQSTVTDELDYWLDRLPAAQDKKANRYVIIPSLGVISPVNTAAVGSNDHERIKYGKTFDINEYLKSGIFHYPETALPGHLGNGVYFGHSSYWVNDPGRYKTIFTTIPLLTAGDKIWVYTRGSDGGAFTKYTYTVTHSYETSPSDVAVMMPTQDATITFVGCTDIGKADGRWIVKASLKPELTKQVVSSNNPGENIVKDYSQSPIQAPIQAELQETTTEDNSGDEDNEQDPEAENTDNEEVEKESELALPTAIPSTSPISGDETSNNQEKTENESTIKPIEITISTKDKQLLESYAQRIKNLTPNGQARVINRLEKYFIHVSNRMTGAVEYAAYLEQLLK